METIHKYILFGGRELTGYSKEEIVEKMSRTGECRSADIRNYMQQMRRRLRLSYPSLHISTKSAGDFLNSLVHHALAIEVITR